MFRPAQQLQTGRIIDRVGVGIIGPHLETLRHRKRQKRFDALRRGRPDILQRSEGRIRGDQVRDVVMKIGRTEEYSLLGQRLFEPEIESFAFLGLEVRIREEIEGR